MLVHVAEAHVRTNFKARRPHMVLLAYLLKYDVVDDDDDVLLDVGVDLSPHEAF